MTPTADHTDDSINAAADAAADDDDNDGDGVELTMCRIQLHGRCHDS